VPVLLVDDWSVDAPWFIVEVGFTCVEDWFAETPLVTLWLPLPTCTPGLMLAPAFTAELAMPTLASTPTFGFTLVVLPELEVPGVLLDDVEPEDCVLEAPWPIVDEGLMLVDDWFAETPLETDWSPLPIFTPGLTLAPRFTSVLLMPTFASTPTFGFTLSVRLELVEEADGALEDDDVLPEEGDVTDPLEEPMLLLPLAEPERVVPPIELLVPGAEFVERGEVLLLVVPELALEPVLVSGR
jgi:hypothetical protein